MLEVYNMSISKITIENYKSIKFCSFDVTEMNMLIGENGSGKSSILEAIHYFYENLTNDKLRDDIFDKNNYFSNEITVTITYDLSEFVKIAKANGRLNEYGEYGDGTDGRYNGYYKAILSLVSKNKDNKVKVKMNQIKNRTIKWNYSYQDRQLIKSLFPIFLIDSRHLDVKEWSLIWDIVGELTKVSNREKKRLEAEIEKLLINSENTISKKINIISEIFSKTDVSIRKTTSSKFAQKLAQVFFSGDEIYQKGKNPSYYSTGTNSVKYLEVLLLIVDELSKAKLKEPLLLIDEPEISLHHCYIDELTTTISKLTGRANFIISTHSPRIIKNIIVGIDEVYLYKVSLLGKYTRLKKMKSFTEYSPNSKYRVTDDHINSYFSKVAVFVEGETELELFSNPYLKALFPALEKVDVFKGVSDKPVLNIMNPRTVGTNTPYLVLIDMDKALLYNIKNNKFALRKEYITDNRREYFQYRNKKDNYTYIHNQYKRIQAMVNKLKIKYYLPFYSTRDANFYELLRNIKEYLSFYNVFAFNSTVEGALINKYTMSFTIDFIKKRTNSVKTLSFDEFKLEFDKYLYNDQLNLLRYIFRGKSDLLQYDIINADGFDGKNTVDKLQSLFKKGSGWITEYIYYYFSEKTEMNGDLTVKNFRRFLENNENRLKLIKEFRHSFPELFSLIRSIYVIIK